MKCRICQNETGNIQFGLKEMMYGLKDQFDYFQCAACECIQILNPPDNIDKYYPGDYYSYNYSQNLEKASLFTKLQCKSIIKANKNWLDKILAFKYTPPEYYQTLRFLKLYKSSSPILDVGSGVGELLKKFYKIGYKDLTGIDPYIKKDIIYDNGFKIEKMGLFNVEREYDAIILNHSLEHMDHQLEVLKKLYVILSKNGRVLIRIPIVSKPLMEQYGANVVSLDAPRHFFIHSLKSIGLLLGKAGFIAENIIYDAHEFSFWGSEQYKNNISLNNNPESYLVKKTFSDKQMEEWRAKIAEMNKAGESDNVAIYLKKSF